jgi:hypothetical protein
MGTVLLKYRRRIDLYKTQLRMMEEPSSGSLTTLWTMIQTNMIVIQPTMVMI